MRATFFRPWAAVAVLIALCSVVDGGEQFPYRARVTAQQALLHSGPGDDYYATDRLAAGDVVEVYNEAPGGWLAIRPPANSFSWVFGRHIDVLEGGLGRINKRDVASRIGGLESQKREVIQVRLQENELVAIIDEPGGGDGLWVKIKPPAGEFRWIHADGVEVVSEPVKPLHHRDELPPEREATGSEAEFSTPELDPPATPATAPGGDEQEPLPGDGWSRQVAPPEPPLEAAAMPAPAEAPTTDEPTNTVAEPRLPPAVPLNDSGWVVTTAHSEPVPKPSNTTTSRQSGAATQPTPPPLLDYPPPPARIAEDPRFKSPERGRSNSATGTHGERSRYSAQVPNATASAATPAASGPATPPAGTGASQNNTSDFSPEFAQRLTALEWQLSQTVADDRQEWHLENLERDAEALLTTAQTVAEREAARHTLNKIDRFANIQRRFEQTSAAPTGLETAPLTTENASAVASVAPPVTPLGPQPMTRPMTTPFIASAPAGPAHRQPAVASPVSVPPGPRGRTWRYDAEGILQPVRSSRPGAPQYALVDEAGRLVTFITPTPDVDAQPFVGKRVGVVGRSAYLPDLGQPNLTAGRISPLAQPLIR